MKSFIKRPAAVISRIMLLLACMGPATGALAAGEQQQVKLPQRTLTLGEAFAQIEAQTGRVVAYANREVDVIHVVTPSRTAGTVEEVVAALLEESGQTFKTDGNYIIISQAPARPAAKPTPEPKPELKAVPPPAAPDLVQGVAIPAVSQRVAITPQPQPASPPVGRPVSVYNSYDFTQTPRWALKTNLLSDLSTTINLAGEFRLGHKTTLDLPFSLNPWTFDKAENTKFKFFLVQPELRLWGCEAFNGHFFGIHAHYAFFNVGRLPNPPFSETMHDYRFQGQLAGAGVSYGYHWIVAPRWGIEAEIGAGYARLWYDKYPCERCSKQFTGETKNYWGVTRAAVNLMYLF